MSKKSKHLINHKIHLRNTTVFTFLKFDDLLLSARQSLSVTIFYARIKETKDRTRIWESLQRGNK